MRSTIIIVVDDIDGRRLHRSVRSVLRQAYSTLGNDRARRRMHAAGQTLVHRQAAWQRSAGQISVGPPQHGIAVARQETLALSSNDFVVWLDNGDELDLAALSEFAAAIPINPDADVLSSDEDRIGHAPLGSFADRFFYGSPRAKNDRASHRTS